MRFAQDSSHRAVREDESRIDGDGPPQPGRIHAHLGSRNSAQAFFCQEAACSFAKSAKLRAGVPVIFATSSVTTAA